MQAMLDVLLKRVMQLEAKGKNSFRSLSGLPLNPSGGGDLVGQRVIY